MEDELSSLFQDSKAEPGKTPHVVTFADLGVSPSDIKASNENVVPTASRKRKGPAGKKVTRTRKKRAGERTIKYPDRQFSISTKTTYRIQALTYLLLLL